MTKCIAKPPSGTLFYLVKEEILEKRQKYR